MGRQLLLFGKLQAPPRRTDHGGDIGRHRRKLPRPFAARQPIHVVMRSSRARGAWSLCHPTCERLVQRALVRFARRYDVRVYEFANSGNHLHILVRSSCKVGFQNFLRAFAGVTARLVTGARKGVRVGKFWDTLAYSRIVAWGREFFAVRAYVVQNEFEAKGYPYLKRARQRSASGITNSKQLE